MATDPENIRRRDYALSEIAASNLSAALKEDLSGVVSRAADATNGLTARDKLQACTENQFDMARLMALFIVGQGRRVTSWKDVAIAFKWPLVILGLGALFLLALHPELADFFRSLAHEIRS